MLVHKGELLLGRSLAVDQGAHRPQPMREPIPKRTELGGRVVASARSGFAVAVAVLIVPPHIRVI
jgi:hypothetical protein